MEQVEGGDLVVNKGNESKHKESGETKREMNAVEGFEPALKLAQVYPPFGSHIPRPSVCSRPPHNRPISMNS